MKPAAASRCGYTLIELSIAVVIVALVIDAGNELLTQLTRAARSTDQAAFRVDLACDRLRRDLMAEARVEGGDLLANRARWHLEGRQLMRNRVHVCTVDAANWSMADGVLRVRLRPSGLPEREIAACR